MATLIDTLITIEMSIFTGCAELYYFSPMNDCSTFLRVR